MDRSLARWLMAAAGSVLLGFALIGGGFYWHFLRSGPAPAPWHEVRLADFTDAQAATVRTLDDYLALEDRLFADLQQRVYGAVPPADRILFNRFSAGSRSDPGVWPVNWNRTFRLEPPSGMPSRGAALLLHGLTDSPYSLRSIGEHLAARGFEVVGLRLPGHGTAPSGLLSFQIEDMQAAVRLAVRDLYSRGAADRPLYLVGYSNGAALAVDYALAALDDAALPRPAGLVLISPAIGISKLFPLQQLMAAYGPVGPINDWIFQKPGATIDTPTNLVAALHLEEWIKNGYFPPDINAIEYTDAADRFGKGDGVFTFNGDWQNGGYDAAMPGNVGFFLFPPAEAGGGYAAMSAPLTYGIAANAKHADCAAFFFNWAATNETARQINVDGMGSNPGGPVDASVPTVAAGSVTIDTLAAGPNLSGAAEGLGEHAIGARVAIVEGVAKQRTIFIQQCKIDTPGVDSDAVRFACVVADGGGYSLLDFGKEAQCVPVDAVPQADGPVWEP